jgi:hypothetical protein
MIAIAGRCSLNSSSPLSGRARWRLFGDGISVRGLRYVSTVTGQIARMHDEKRPERWVTVVHTLEDVEHAIEDHANIGTGARAAVTPAATA